MMKWHLKQIKQETSHPFLNFFTAVFDVEKEGHSHHEYEYYFASRHDIDHLMLKTKDFNHADGVVMPLYYIDDKGKVSLLMTRQFRPAIGAYLTSFPAGLIDKSDDDLFSAVKREAKEEAGVEITDLEILAKPGATSSGLSDEINAVVLARITSFNHNSLEEFEDIKTSLVPLEELKKMFDDDNYHFPVNIKILCLYLLERFS